MNPLKLRDEFWDYPQILFVGKKSLWGELTTFYQSTRPFSYIITTLLVTLILGIILLTRIQSVLVNSQFTFVEGIVVGTDAAGDPIGPNRLNPLQTTNTQLDRDILQLIYEPLIRLDQSGNVIPILADNYSSQDTKSGKTYRFSLRKNVYWHDGKRFTTQDIKATFDLIKELANSGVENIYGTQAAKNLELNILDDYICEFKVTKGTLPNFYELITFSILPAHLIKQYRDAIINGQYTGQGKLISIGTGPFILNDIAPDNVNLIANSKYYLGEPKIKNFQFKLLRNENEALTAIKSGEIHGIASLSNTFLTQAIDSPNMGLLSSDTIYSEYWGIYFNLTSTGSTLIKDKKVRTAFSQSIDRDILAKSFFTKAEVALGPIAQNSPYYAGDANQQPKYNPNAAIQTLNNAGWTISQVTNSTNNSVVKIAQKNNIPLKLTLAYADNPDKVRIVNSIVNNLANVGIQIILKPLSASELVTARTTQNFDLLLYGVSTFVDPDRYEFFHSNENQSGNNVGLNISGYVSEKSKPIIDPVKKKSVIVPLVDVLLDEARKTSNNDTRKEKYLEFQKILADEVPVIFLYHPSLDYLVSKRIKNIDLTNMYSEEERFINVQNWEIKVE